MDAKHTLLSLANAEGPSARTALKRRCYARIQNSRFSGKGNYKYEQYVQVHIRAYAELEKLEETVADTKKVSDFMDHITDPRLTSTKQIVLGDPVKNENFERCHQFIGSIIVQMDGGKNQASEFERRVAALEAKVVAKAQDWHRRHPTPLVAEW